MTSFHQHCMLEDVLEMPHIVRCTILEDFSYSSSLTHLPDIGQMRFQTRSERHRHHRQIELDHHVIRVKARPFLSFFFDFLANFIPGLMLIELLELILGGHVADV